jgi:hypothetical protein
MAKTTTKKRTKPPAEVEAVLAAMDAERRADVERLREAINAQLPAGYVEGVQYGMVAWFVPHERYPDGYHCDASQPLPFVQVAARKSGVAAYLMGLYMDESLTAWFTDAWKAAGLKLDMGKSCVRMKRVTPEAASLIGEAVSKLPMDRYVALYESSMKPSGARKKAGAKKASKKTTSKKKTASKKKASKKKTSSKKKAVSKKRTR